MPPAPDGDAADGTAVGAGAATTAGATTATGGAATAATTMATLAAPAVRVPVARAPRPGTIRQGDRDKALRPLTLEQRRHAFEAGLAAYARGDFFEAHEELEPAWMGTDDLAERALHQGLIKVAAAYVHAVRGNPAGIARNLEGARRHLALAGPAAAAWGVDVDALRQQVDARLADPRRTASDPPPAIRRTPTP